MAPLFTYYDEIEVYMIIKAQSHWLDKMEIGEALHKSWFVA
jgi:hypothetical protein